MYQPPHFREDRIDVLHDLIRSHPLATLVTVGPDGLVANHIPLLLDLEPAPMGTLRGHVARANPLWRLAAEGADALAIFSGPESYVSPSWYPSKAETGRVVPTWNYAVVHAAGPLRTFGDPAALRAHVSSLTDRHERGLPDAWAVDDAPEEFVQRQLRGIVGIEMPITRIEGKWKMSQNRQPADRRGVVEALEASGGEAGCAVAEMVAASDRS